MPVEKRDPRENVFSVMLLSDYMLPMPPAEQMLDVIAKFAGETKLLDYSSKMASFIPVEFTGEIADTEIPVSLIISGCEKMYGYIYEEYSAAVQKKYGTSQQKLYNCRYQITATDFLAGTLPAADRLKLDRAFLQALVKIYPDCMRIYMPKTGAVYTKDEITGIYA